MTAAQLEIPVTGRMRSLEVRWILPGRLEAGVARWFARFPAVWNHAKMPILSVKLRDGRALEVKVYHGSPGVLEVAGRARGRPESWDKWSFPCDLGAG